MSSFPPFGQNPNSGPPRGSLPVGFHMTDHLKKKKTSHVDKKRRSVIQMKNSIIGGLCHKPEFHFLDQSGWRCKSRKCSISHWELKEEMQARSQVTQTLHKLSPRGPGTHPISTCDRDNVKFQDPPPSEDDLQRNRRKRGADGDKSSEEDDSDMYLEPESVEIMKKPQKPQVTTRKPVTEVPVKTKDNQQMGQHFFPSFAPVFSLGHSRPHQLFHQEPFYSSKSRSPSSLGPDFNPFRAYRDSSYKIPITIEDDAISTNILGSGNFGVLRGGTFYNEDDEYGGLFSPHYSNNGHGRPYYSNPRPQKYSNGDFFSNFRDFADINTPTKASYSEYVVVYVNKNATKSEPGKTVAPGEISRPKNIFEQLTLLDQDEPLSSSEETTTEKKQSLHKRKLALLKQEKLNKEKKSYYKSRETGKDFLEPLIALS